MDKIFDKLEQLFDKIEMKTALRVLYVATALHVVSCIVLVIMIMTQGLP